MARKRKFTETMLLKLPEGTFADIQGVLGDTEDRVELVRIAVAREIARRKREITAGKRRPGTTHTTPQVPAPD